MTLPRRFVSLLLIYCFAIAVAPLPHVAASSSNNRALVQDEASDEDDGLQYRLSEGRPDQPKPPAATKVAAATVLSNAETEAVLKRLPSIKSETRDETEFAWRERSLAPGSMRLFPALHCTLELFRWPCFNLLGSNEENPFGKSGRVAFYPDVIPLDTAEIVCRFIFTSQACFEFNDEKTSIVVDLVDLPISFIELGTVPKRSAVLKFSTARVEV